MQYVVGLGHPRGQERGKHTGGHHQEVRGDQVRQGGDLARVTQVLHDVMSPVNLICRCLRYEISTRFILIPTFNWIVNCKMRMFRCILC